MKPRIGLRDPRDLHHRHPLPISESELAREDPLG
jgi:hypothetical protein